MCLDIPSGEALFLDESARVIGGVLNDDTDSDGVAMSPRGRFIIGGAFTMDLRGAISIDGDVADFNEVEIVFGDFFSLSEELSAISNDSRFEKLE